MRGMPRSCGLARRAGACGTARRMRRAAPHPCPSPRKRGEGSVVPLPCKRAEGSVVPLPCKRSEGWSFPSPRHRGEKVPGGRMRGMPRFGGVRESGCLRHRAAPHPCPSPRKRGEGSVVPLPCKRAEGSVVPLPCKRSEGSSFPSPRHRGEKVPGGRMRGMPRFGRVRESGCLRHRAAHAPRGPSPLPLSPQAGRGERRSSPLQAGRGERRGPHPGLFPCWRVERHSLVRRRQLCPLPAMAGAGAVIRSRFVPGARSWRCGCVRGWVAAAGWWCTSRS
jgi:hypothetical protein